MDHDYIYSILESDNTSLSANSNEENSLISVNHSSISDNDNDSITASATSLPDNSAAPQVGTVIHSIVVLQVNNKLPSFKRGVEFGLDLADQYLEDQDLHIAEQLEAAK